MLALAITDLKDFTEKLFIGSVFDPFFLVEASFTTFGRFSIDGRLQKEFFDTDERKLLQENARTYTYWGDVKYYCRFIIRGKRTPLQFKIILSSDGKIGNRLSVSPGIADGLYLNLQFRDGLLQCTTGVSLKTFSPDRKPEQLWDDFILNYFRSQEILFREL
ncbi:MAG: DUF5721 family protein [Clostridiales bacterium]|nr:DUF5721 family protein [Clostridiales bacterium]